MQLFKNKMQNESYSKADLDIFISHYKKDANKIFREIYTYLKKKEYTSENEFINNYKVMISKEKNKIKELSNGLLLQLGNPSGALELTDKYSSFRIKIEFIKEIPVQKPNKKTKFKFIISKDYYNKIIKKKYHIKTKYKNNLSESSLESCELGEKIIYNNNFEYLSIIPNYQNIYKNIFEILKKDKSNIAMAPYEFFNEYRLLTFPDIQKYDIKKMIWNNNTIVMNNNKYKYFIYNKKIGLSLYLQRNINYFLVNNHKSFYLNIDFLFNEVSNKCIKKYLFYYLSYLFSEKDYQEYVNFIEKNILDIIYYKGAKLIQNLLEVLKNNFKDFYLCVDNIKTKEEFNIINTFISSNKINFEAFIQINGNTLDCLNDINYHLIYNIPENKDLFNDITYYLPLYFGEINKAKIKENISEKLKSYFEKVDFESYRYLLKIKHFLNSKYIEINELKKYSSFLEEFLLISKINKKVVDKIILRNDIIKELFDNLYEFFVIRIKNTNNNIISEFNKSNEGINFERQVIYDMITNNANINKIKINRIFSIKTFNPFEINNNNEFIIIQQKDNSPYYDFAYIYRELNLNILKSCQIGINKGIRELIKIKIFFYLIYFIFAKNY